MTIFCSSTRSWGDYFVLSVNTDFRVACPDKNDPKYLKTPLSPTCYAWGGTCLGVDCVDWMLSELASVSSVKVKLSICLASRSFSIYSHSSVSLVPWVTLIKARPPACQSVPHPAPFARSGALCLSRPDEPWAQSILSEPSRVGPTLNILSGLLTLRSSLSICILLWFSNMSSLYQLQQAVLLVALHEVEFPL